MLLEWFWGFQNDQYALKTLRNHSVSFLLVGSIYDSIFYEELL